MKFIKFIYYGNSNYQLPYTDHDLKIIDKTMLSNKRKNVYLPKVGNLLRTLVIILSLLILGGCVDRPRDNPLDPQNPKTLGKPTGMRLSCEERQVKISWDRLDIDGLAGINIRRLAEGDSGFEKINDTPIPGREFEDRNVEYGVEYTYKITAVTEGYESPDSEPKAIVPGPTYTWVADSYYGQIIRYCHDLRYTLFYLGAIAYPTAIAASSSERAAWVLERYSNRLYKISHMGKLEVINREFTSPTALAVNQTNGDVWVVQQFHNTVSHLNHEGNVIWSFDAFEEPYAVDVNEVSGECWVADHKAGTVSRIPQFARGVYPIDRPFMSPQDITIDPENGAIWVADSTRVVRYGYAGHGSWTEIYGFFWASLVASCRNSSCCWVVDLCKPGESAKLLKLDVEGNILFELAEFGSPRGISINRFDGSCLVADTGYGKLVKVSSDGKDIEYIQSNLIPQDVSVENH